MPTTTGSDLVEAVRLSVHPLGAEPAPYDRLIGMIGDARLVLLGSASHGTHEFYRERGEITKRLIQEKGFRAVCVEADWPDASRVDQYVRGTSDDRDPAAALADFRRFPNWMWRNTDVVEFVEWCRRHNDGLRPVAGSDAARPKVSFHGLDLYNLQASREAVLRYLENVDPKAAMRVRARYACLDSADQASRGYAVLAGGQITQSCKSEALAGLVELQRLAAPGRADRPPEDDTLFDALQNARLVKNAEAFYRSMFLSEESAWNLRERHMEETLETLLQQLDRGGGRSKAVVWAHNSHVGDAPGHRDEEPRRAESRAARPRPARRRRGAGGLHHVPRQCHRRAGLGEAGRAPVAAPRAARQHRGHLPRHRRRPLAAHRAGGG
jgi:erythromycin esterase-like protein